MADKKISQLTAATTPLDGTEVLPVVQGTTTKKVANNDLRPKQIQSNTTSGVLQIVGPAAASTRVMTTPDANFTAARTDAGQTFVGTQTFASIGTAGIANLGNSANSVSGGGYTHRISGKSISPDGSTWLSSYGAVVFNAGSDYTGNARRYLFTNALDQRNFAIIRSVDATTDPTLGNGGSVSSGFADLVVTNTGNVQVGTGNLIIGTSGKGIDFSATSEGSGTMTSELLADYEEGTWTPVVVGTTTAGTGTYTTQTGSYTKVGRLVSFSMTLGWSNHTGTGNFYISGLPYTSSASLGQYTQAISSYNLTFTGQLCSYISASSTAVYPLQVASNSAYSLIAMDTAVTELMISGSYYV